MHAAGRFRGPEGGTVAFADDVLRVLQRAGHPLDDDVLAARLRVSRQQVNQTCRRLARQGVLRRVLGPDGKLINQLGSSDEPETRSAVTSPPRPAPATDATWVSEDDVKTALKQHLEAQGFAVTVAWGRERGIDIDARRGAERWVIEAKGNAPRGPQQVNYFLHALGELVQRMSDDTAQYGLALPDDPQYHGLVARLPPVARRRLALIVFFVRREGSGMAVQVDAAGR